jgi:radical SAM superfamily enzyme YgiQ (UPF0313 family)
VLEQAGHTAALRDFSDRNDWDEFSSFVGNAAYDVYILHTVLLSESIDLRAAQEVLDRTQSRVIFFGPHPTLKPRTFLLSERCFVARGEAEFIIRDLVQALASGDPSAVKGVSFLRKGALVETETAGVIEDLDVLPFPARHLLDPSHDETFNPKLPYRPVTLVLTSRGCRFRCYYCVPNAISWARELEWKRYQGGNKPPVTLRSPRNIVEEFRAVKQLGYQAVSIVDDMFLFGGKQRVLDLCAGLEAVGMPFGGLARCDLILDDEMVAALARAGCKYMDLGIESLDQGVLDGIRKDMDATKVRKAIDLLNKYGIEPKANIMFGATPKETRETIAKTIGTISSYPLNYCMFLIATPFPGTEFSEQAKAGHWVTPEIDDLENNLSPTDKSLLSYPHLGKDDLEAAVKRANRRFYLSPHRLWFQLRKIRSWKDLRDLVRTGWKVVR